jgi:hypothetical protein
MLKSSISNEELYTFMSNVQGITKRAVRLNHEQNQDKFEREAMGSLLKVAGYDFEKLFSLLNEYPKIFDFEENIKKLKVMENLSAVLGSRFTALDMINFKDSKGLVGFIDAYFSSYSNEYNGFLRFHCEEQVEQGFKMGYVLVCTSIDSLSCVSAPSKREVIFLNYNTSPINISEIIEKIKNIFPDYIEVEKKKTTHTISQKIKIIEKREYEADSFMSQKQSSLIGKNELYVDYAELSFEDKVKIKPIFYVNSILCHNGYYYINGLEYFANELDGFEESESLFAYFNEVVKQMGIFEDMVIKTNINNINKLRKEYELLDANSEEDSKEFLESCYYGYIENIKYGILENISKGLNESFFNAENSIEINRPAWNTIRKTILNKKWESVGNDLYSRDVQA